MLATKKEHTAVVNALLDAKADPNITDKVCFCQDDNYVVPCL